MYRQKHSLTHDLRQRVQRRPGYCYFRPRVIRWFFGQTVLYVHYRERPSFRPQKQMAAVCEFKPINIIFMVLKLLTSVEFQCCTENWHFIIYFFSCGERGMLSANNVIPFNTFWQFQSIDPHSEQSVKVVA